ncbi:SET domain protein, putative [Plasmodium vinckei lentum]|uniref:SET domain protein, putative n=1 Tax=Plasmodium vinckei lentum TaxID=138297 RepID=A0A6V7S0X5_PLAVN|nr:SET domain protein, putative [Plasmodium vinckei lentum]
MKKNKTNTTFETSKHIDNDTFENINPSFKDLVSIIWIEKEKLDSIVHIPLYADLSKYFDDLNKNPINQGNDTSIISKVYLLFDDNSCNIALDISPICGYRSNHIPLLIYDRYYFWSLHFLFEKSKVKRQKLNINTKLGIQDCINKYNIYDELDMYTSIYNSAYNKYENTKDTQLNGYELNKRRNENTNKHDSKNGNMLNNDQIKYSYLNGLKNNNNILENNSNYINEVKWYRLKIKIEEAGKKNKNQCFSYSTNNVKNKNADKCNPKKSSAINNFSCLTNEKENANLNKLIKIQKKKATILNQNKVKTEDTKNKSQIINNSSCNTQKNEKNGNEEKPIVISDTDNNIPTNNNAKRKKRKTWYYCHSSSNDMTDDDGKADSIVDSHEIYIENYNEGNTGVKGGEHNEYFETDNHCRENNFNRSHGGQSQNSIYDENNTIDKLECKDAGKEIDNKNSNNNNSTKLEGMKNHCINMEDTFIGNDTEIKKENEQNLKTKNICIEENNTNKPINLNENTKLILESSKLYKLENYEYVNCFKNMFYNNLEDQQNQINHHIFKKNKFGKDCIDLYINKILKNILDKKKPHLNSLSKSFERIETFYKKNYKIFIIDDEDFYTCDKKEHFKNQNYLYELSEQKIKNDFQNFEDNDIFNYFKKYIPTERDVQKLTSKPQGSCHTFQNECITAENVDIEGQSYSNFKEGIDTKEKCGAEGNALSKEGTTETNHLPQNSLSTEFNKDCNDQNRKLEGISENTEIVTDADVIFVFISKKHKCLEKKLKQGDYIYVKFNDACYSYDKVKILPKKIIIQILIYLIKNSENIKLTTISTYSPDLLWNISLHFRNYIIDLDMCFEKLYKFFSEKREQENENDGKQEVKQRLADFSDSCVPYYGKSQNKKQDIEIMKLKDSVNFIDKFLQNVNSKKIEKLKKARIEYYEKYEYDRTINKLNKQQLIDLFIDKETEINIIPLSYLKEKSRNIIYEENLKMNMFACIKVIFDSTKGRCIYADAQINKFDFVFEYVGELLTHNEAMEREQTYIKNKKKGCYMFYFKHENKRYCIDGTEESIDAAINYANKKYFLRSFARLVNHSKKNANLIPKVLTVDLIPRLFFIASRDIQKGEELLIDYGERDREIIKDNEWLKL